MSLLDTILDLSPRRLWRVAARQGAALGRRVDGRSTVPKVSAQFVERQDRVIQSLLERRLAGEPLAELLRGFDAKNYGERVVEYPVFLDWLLAQPTGLDLLDVGCVLNKSFLGPVLNERCRALWLCNPAVEPLAIDGPPVFYHLAPLDKAFRRGPTFSLITCLSTLEHIGFDNSHYGASVPPRFAEPADEPFIESFGQLSHLLAPGGRLLISFPYGQREALLHPSTGRASSQVLDHGALERCLPAFAAAGVEIEVEIYAATADGWQRQEPRNDAFRYANGCPGAEAVAVLKGLRGGQ